MNEGTDGRHRSPASADYDISRLQRTLATRCLLIFALPFLVILVLGGYSYQLSSRVTELEALQQISFIERLMRKNYSHEWALTEYQKLVHYYPHPQVWVRLGALYFERGTPEDRLQAVAILEQAKAIEPDYWETYSTLAYIYMQEQNESKAIEAGEMAVQLNTLDGQTYNNLAWLHATSTNPDISNLAKAQEYALKAVGYTRGRNSQYMDTLAEIYARTGRVNLAMETLQQAISGESRDIRYFESRLSALQMRARHD
jgi:tetratricopeptide (TPR) repeat protein